MAYGPDLLGSQVSDNRPYTVWASTINNPGAQAYLAFDGNDGTHWATEGGDYGTIGVDFGANNGKKITRYFMANNPAGAIYQMNDWTFQGSNNNSDWDVLDTQTGQTSGGTYSFSNTTSYRYYRLVCTADGGAGRILLPTLTMHETVTTPVVVNYGPDLLGNQTSETSPYVVSSNNEHPGYPAWKMFDGDDGTYWNSNGPCQTVVHKVDFGVGNLKSVKKYALKFYSAPANCLNSWTFEGSNDNANWTVLDTQVGQSSFAGTTKSYEFSNAASYRYYRLNVTDAAAPGDGAAMYTFNMYASLHRLISPMITSFND